LFPLTLDTTDNAAQAFELDTFKELDVVCEAALGSGRTRLAAAGNCTAPVIRRAVDLARTREAAYCVLVVFLHNDPADVKKTIDVVIEASLQPISIMFVGMSNKLALLDEYVDNDAKLLRSRAGKEANRDVVQVLQAGAGISDVDFSNRLTAELPRQFEQAMRSAHISPVGSKSTFC
jgi:hypothetical protein